ncbi:hypothetical protein [Amycolatopsis sp. PS_44_ISF1]|uniref:hypothetical protein n=1 Tax=Amycolatopsis sp. PS_44_ISF1 TaxID=2974917 RepID=UPI0028DE8253|nr:hypothetical protein [Amycolatopsis sp. PS_44_ISF1]MDT8913139.1 hypothetical protein [Amycolatopsis sp. PS_44_ISF1]
MDDTAVTAVLAVPADRLGTEIEKFFEVLIEVQTSGPGPDSLDGLVAVVGEREPSFAAAAEEFRENLRAEGIDGHWADIARSLVDEGGSGARLARLREQFDREPDREPDAGDATAVAEPDGAPGDWAGFQATNRDFWLGWDGTGWDPWRAAFAEGAAGAGVGAELEPHLVWLDGLDAADRMTYVRDTLGFAIDEDALAGLNGDGPSPIPAGLAEEISASVPGFEQLSDAEIAAVVAEALQEAED